MLVVTVLQGEKEFTLIAEPSAWLCGIWASLVQGGLKESAMEVSHLKTQDSHPAGDIHALAPGLLCSTHERVSRLLLGPGGLRH